LVRWSNYSKQRFVLVSCLAYYSVLSFACYLLYAGFLLGIFFDPEDGGDIFLQNVDCFSTDCSALYRRISSMRNVIQQIEAFKEAGFKK
jgi:uncharacterized BrkB/YihY/UPF0761 family membrane protein